MDVEGQTERRSPTLEQVADVAGVSRATVSRVINGVRNVDPALAAQVQDAIAAIGYVPNRAARSLVTRRADALALVISGAGDGGPGSILGDPFFGRVAGGVIGFLRPQGMHPVLMLAESEPARDEVVEYLRRGNADGALLVSTHSDDSLPARLIEAGVPSVLFARPADPIPISYVDLAHRDGGGLAAEHLLRRGCRMIATISGPRAVNASQERLYGFRDALARHGRPYVPCAEGNFTRDSGEQAMKRLLAAHPDIDGVFALNDLMAQGAIHALRDSGRPVPDQVAVVGFDDSSAAVEELPELTTVRQPVEDMAAEMARMLLDRIADPGREVTSVIFEPELVVRESG
ncbi:LacI family DNA-binding transcriptional regulator [Phytomonospora sp. NPDC050363]|uniref:LacI family DNA-binding transcriptional regulator n=1 Tax=Phytomonospora sp. NPDC050363 TaxID=3155642 RepID=UPI0033C31CBF